MCAQEVLTVRRPATVSEGIRQRWTALTCLGRIVEEELIAVGIINHQEPVAP